MASEKTVINSVSKKPREEGDDMCVEVHDYEAVASHACLLVNIASVHQWLEFPLCDGVRFSEPLHAFFLSFFVYYFFQLMTTGDRVLGKAKAQRQNVTDGRP